MAWLVTGKEISFIKKSRENDEFYTHKKKKMKMRREKFLTMD